MPTYQYACTECGHDFEQFQSFSDDALTVCPQCSGKLRKVYNAVGVVFKGSGFYRNDSRATTTSSDAGSSGASGETKGESAGGDKGGDKGGTKTEPTKTDSSASGGTKSTPTPTSTKGTSKPSDG